MHKAGERGAEIHFLELSVLIMSDQSEAMAFPPLYSHPSKTMGTVWHQVDKPDSVLAQNEHVTGSWK